MADNFSYLIDKIKKAEFHELPFKHLELKQFLNEKDFKEITRTQEINLTEEKKSDLKDKLKNAIRTSVNKIISEYFPII